MSGLTREGIVKALHDKGAYCGVCDYETALDGTPGCSECQQVLGGYADAVLALAPTVDEDTITIPRPHVPFGPDHLSADAADVSYLREAARRIKHVRLFGSNLTETVAKLISDAGDAIEAGGRP